MNVIVTLEYRFKRTPDGKVWTEMSFQKPFWDRYLKVFDKVIITSRILEVKELKSPHHIVSGDNLEFHAIPYYHGPKQFYFQRKKIKSSLRNLINNNPDAAIIMRVGSPIADLFQKLLPSNRPYALEVVGDPWEVFRPGTINNPLRPFMRLFFTYKLKAQCRKAKALSYVTERALQQRYPGAKNSFQTNASTIELLPEHIINEEKKYKQDKEKSFVYVGTLEQLQKAPDLIIKAVEKIKHKSFKVKFIGDGKLKPALEQLSRDLDISDKIEFKGLLPAGDKIRKELDQSDFFILPSRGEGLPRAMIEAMARGLPCLGSNIGGIQELLNKEEIVKVGSVKELAFKMESFIDMTQDRYEYLSKENLEKSKRYLNSELEKRRTNFYTFVKQKTTNWINTNE